MIKQFEMDFEEKQCVTCGCIYFVPSNVLRIHRENGTSFYCYNGHAQVYCKTVSQIKQERIDELEQIKINRESEIQRLSSTVLDLRKQLIPSKPVKRRAKRISK